MAAPGGKFFIQENIKKVAPHHESYAQLWKTKWAFPVRPDARNDLWDYTNTSLPGKYGGLSIHVRHWEGLHRYH